MKAFCITLASALLLSACATPPQVYKAETFSPATPYQHASRLNAVSTCEAGRRALLSQGYQIAEKGPDRIEGSKAFQPIAGHHMTLDIALVCLSSSSGASIFASAKQTHYELKAGNSSAGVSVAGMGSISLPWSATNENLVKVGEETVSDAGFYERFFSLVESFM
jgi:hypothetical protein